MQDYFLLKLVCVFSTVANTHLKEGMNIIITDTVSPLSPRGLEKPLEGATTNKCKVVSMWCYDLYRPVCCFTTSTCAHSFRNQNDRGGILNFSPKYYKYFTLTVIRSEVSSLRTT